MQKIFTTICLIIFLFQTSFSQTNPVYVNTVSIPSATKYFGDNLIKVYEINVVAKYASATITSLTLKTGGLYNIDDVKGFKIYSADNYFGNVYELNSNVTPASQNGDLITFSNFNFGGGINLVPYNSRTFAFVVELKPNATPGHYFKINGLTDPVTLTYSSNSNTINNQSDLAGQINIGESKIRLVTENVPEGKIYSGSSGNVIGRFSLEKENGNGFFKKITFKFSGDYTSSDVISFRLYISRGGNFDPLSDYMIQMATNSDSIVFDGLNLFNSPFQGQNLDQNNVGIYIFITADIDKNPTLGKQIRCIPELAKIEFTNKAILNNNYTNSFGVKTIGSSKVRIETLPSSKNFISRGSTEKIYEAEIFGQEGKSVISGLEFSPEGTSGSNDIIGFVFYLKGYPYSTNQQGTYIGQSDYFGGSGEIFRINFNSVLTIEESSQYVVEIHAKVSENAIPGKTIKITGGANNPKFFVNPNTEKLDFQSDLSISKEIRKSKFRITNLPLEPINAFIGKSSYDLLKIKVEALEGGGTLKKIGLKTTGTSLPGDFKYFSVFDSQNENINTNFELEPGGYSYMTVPSSDGALSFEGFWSTIIPGSPSYFHVLFQPSDSAVLGRTIKVLVDNLESMFQFNSEVELIKDFTEHNGTATIRKSVFTITSNPVSLGYIYSGSQKNIISSFQLTREAGIASANNLIFKLDGSFDQNDIESFDLYYSSTSSLNYSSIKVNSSPGAFLFSEKKVSFYPALFTSNYWGAGILQPGYYFLAVNLKPNAINDKTLSLKNVQDAITAGFNEPSEITYNILNPAIFTIKWASVNVFSVFSENRPFYTGQTKNNLYALRIERPQKSSKISKVMIKTSGNYLPSDITSFDLYYSRSNNLDNPTLLSHYPIPSSGAGETLEFNFNDSFNDFGDFVYLILSADINPLATLGKTLNVNPNSTNVSIQFLNSVLVNYDFSQSSGIKTIEGSILKVTTIPLPSQEIFYEKNPNPIYSFNLKKAVGVPQITRINVKLSGNYNYQDINRFYLFKGSVNDLYPTQIAYTTSLSSGNGEVISFLFDHAQSEYYFTGDSANYFIGAYLNQNFAPGHTIKVNGLINPITIQNTNRTTVINNQSDLCGLQTMERSVVRISTIETSDAIAYQGEKQIAYKFFVKVLKGRVRISGMELKNQGDLGMFNIESIETKYYSNSNIDYQYWNNNLTNSDSFSESFKVYIGTSDLSQGDSMYFYVVPKFKITAPLQKHLKITPGTLNGGIEFLSNVTVINQQTNTYGKVTVFGANVTFKTLGLNASVLNPGDKKRIIYKVSVLPELGKMHIKRIMARINGNFLSSDISGYNIYISRDSTGDYLDSFISEKLNQTSRSYITNEETVSFDYSCSYCDFTYGTKIFLFLTVDIANNAIENHFLKVNGNDNPIQIQFVNNPIIQNLQSDLSGVHSVQNKQITIETIPTASKEVLTGSSQNEIYKFRLTSTSPIISIPSVKVRFDGTYQPSDIESIGLKFNSYYVLASNFTMPVSGQEVVLSFPQNDITYNSSNPMDFRLFINLKHSATDGSTIKVTGSASNVQVGFPFNVTINNQQSDLAGWITFARPRVLLETIVQNPQDIFMGIENQIVYSVRLTATKGNAIINKASIITSGNYANSDISNFSFGYKISYPENFRSLTELELPTYGAGDTINFNFNNIYLNQNETILLNFAAEPSADAVNGRTIFVDGQINPVLFESPNSTIFENNQQNTIGELTIRRSQISHIIEDISGDKLYFGSTTKPLFKFTINPTIGLSKLKSISFKLTGSYSASDIDKFTIFKKEQNGDSFSYYPLDFYDYTYHNSNGNTETVILSFSDFSNWTFPFVRAPYEFLVVPEVKNSATGGRTIVFDPQVSNLTFTYTNNPQITTQNVPASIIKTISQSKVRIENLLVPTEIIGKGYGKERPIGIYKITSLEGDTELKELLVSTTGSYKNTDINGFYAYAKDYLGYFSNVSYPNSNSSGLGESINVFDSYRMNVPEGQTRYLFLNVRVSSNAVNGRTIKLNDGADLSFFSFSNNPLVEKDFQFQFGTKTIQDISSLNPPVLLASDQVVCSGQTKEITLISYGCSDYQNTVWYRNNETEPFLSGIDVYKVTPSSSVTYHTLCELSGSVSGNSNLTLIDFPTVNNPTNIAQTPTGNVQAFTPVNLLAEGCGTNQVKWENNLIGNPRSIIPEVTGVYEVRCKNQQCESSPLSITVVVSGCPGMINLVSTQDNIQSGIITRKASSTFTSPTGQANIMATNKISGANTKVTYEARSLLFLPGFEVGTGVVFKAQTGGCQ